MGKSEGQNCDNWTGHGRGDEEYVDFKLKRVLPPSPIGNFADMSNLEDNFKPHLLRGVCTLCSGALISDNLL